MSTLNAGEHANLILSPGDVYRVATGGVATVQGIYGAPAATDTITADSQTFGPYDANAKLRVTAVSGDCSYSLQVGMPVEVSPDGTITDPTAIAALQAVPSIGPYADATALEAAHPAASNTGNSAYVGGSAPYAIWDSNGTAWGERGSGGGVVTLTASRALTSDDNGKTLVYAGSTNITLTTVAGVGTCRIEQRGSGRVSITGIGGTASTTTSARIVTLTEVSSGVYRGEREQNLIVDPVRYQKWRAAVAKANSGVAPAKLLIFGDSTSAGTGSTVRTRHRAVQLAKYLAAAGVCPSIAESMVGTCSTNAAIGAYDPRWSLGAGWTGEGNIGETLSPVLSNTTTTNAATFTPANQVDSFEIFYARNTGLGTFSYAVDGGGATNVSTANASAAVGSVVVSAGSLGAHTLSLARVSGSVFILAVRAYSTSSPHIDVITAGKPGAKTTDVQGVANPWDGDGFIAALAPHLTIFSMGLNDCGAGTPSTLAAYTASVTALLTSALISGDVLIVTPPPSSFVTQNALGLYMTDYEDALMGVASSLGVEVLNLRNRWISYASGNALGLYFDNPHPSDAGYADWARAEAVRLALI